MNDDGKTAASAASLSDAALVNLAYETISELEDRVFAIGDYARALGLIASTIDDDSVSSALSRLTGDIIRAAALVTQEAVMSDLSRRTIIARAAAAVPAAAADVPALAEPEDAGLITLGVRLSKAYSAERAVAMRKGSDDELNDAMDACAAVVEEIIAARAVTIRGLQVKAAAIAWACNDEPFSVFGDDTTDRRIVQSLLADLWAMPGR